METTGTDTEEYARRLGETLIDDYATAIESMHTLFAGCGATDIVVTIDVRQNNIAVGSRAQTRGLLVEHGFPGEPLDNSAHPGHVLVVFVVNTEDGLRALIVEYGVSADSNTN